MADRPRQLPLDLPVPVSYGRDDYVVGAANRAAFDLLTGSAQSAETIVLVGPEGAGKTHLAGLFAAATDARTIAAADLGAVDPFDLAAAGAVVVEDAGPGLDERALFHLLNAVRQRAGRCLVTTRTPPADWGLRLADLASRLRAATPVELGLPDDALLEALLAKHFGDRQTVVDPAVVAFLARRMERSFAAAARLVAALDRAALAEKSPITRPMAARVLADLDAEHSPAAPLDGIAAEENNPSR